MCLNRAHEVLCMARLMPRSLETQAFSRKAFAGKAHSHMGTGDLRNRRVFHHVVCHAMLALSQHNSDVAYGKLGSVKKYYSTVTKIGAAYQTMSQ